MAGLSIHSLVQEITRVVVVVAIAMLVPTGIYARALITQSASYEYHSENRHYRLQYIMPDSLRLHYNDTVVPMSLADARKFASLTASLFGKSIIEKKSDTISSGAPIIDISIECAPRVGDKGAAMQRSITRQPTYRYSSEFVELERFVEDLTAPYFYKTEGVWDFGGFDSPPEYKGGNAALLNYFAKNIRLPRELDCSRISGRVILKFEVTSDGSVGKVRVIRTPHNLLSDECTRVLKTLPEKCFIPGKRKGEAVACWHRIPISIRFQ